MTIAPVTRSCYYCQDAIADFMVVTPEHAGCSRMQKSNNVIPPVDDDVVCGGCGC